MSDLVAPEAPPDATPQSGFPPVQLPPGWFDDGSNGSTPHPSARRLRRQAAPRRTGMTSRRRFLTAALLVVLVVALLASVPSLDQVYDRLATMRPGWVALALGLELLSC